MKKQSISVFGLAMFNVAAVLSLRGLPMMADTGMQMIFYLAFASFLFLIPCSLVSAELATGWPEEGGVYLWVKEAFSERWGFLAIWLQWVQNIIWYPVILAFAAGSFAYVLSNPALANNHIYSFVFIVVAFWISTLLTFFGLKYVEKVTSVAVLLGTVLPVIILIGLSGIWLFSGKTINLDIHQSILPNFSKFSNVAFLAGIILLFAGMEVGAVHVKDLANPTRQYPKAVFLALFIIIGIFSLGSFAVAMIVPESEISLTAGILQTFDQEFRDVQMSWLVPIMGILISFGALGGVMAWISGPSKGLLATAKEGEIPPFLAHVNANGIQTNLLILQGIIVTLLATIYLLIDNVSVVFFLLSAMTIALYLIVYMLIFLAALKLRYSQPDVHRTYRVPGGLFGMWLICLIGLAGVIFAFIIAFFPPTALKVASPKLYISVVTAGFIVFTAVPFVIHHFKKPSWRPELSSK